jgi:hypothetical protein
VLLIENTHNGLHGSHSSRRSCRRITNLKDAMRDQTDSWNIGVALDLLTWNRLVSLGIEFVVFDLRVRQLLR